MQVPVQVTFRDMAVSDALEAACWRESKKLERYYERIMGCRVVVSCPHRHHRKGRAYLVRIDLTVPGGELIVNRNSDDAHEDAYVAIREAFRVARRQLEDYTRRQRGNVKVHEPVEHGRVRALDPAGGFGFLETNEGREIYFHRNAVLHEAFPRLTVGSEVRFAETVGDEGPQASTVVVVHRRPFFSD